MKAIICDLDRTLLHTDKSISSYTAEVFKKCRERGMLIMAASARPMRAIIPYNDIIPFDSICATNGAVISLPSGTLEVSFSTESGEAIISKLLEFPDVFLSVETSKGLYSNRDIPIWNPIIYEKFPSLPEDIVLYKILASSKESSLYEHIESTLTDDVYHTIADKVLIQIMSKNATKWNGVCKMLEYYSISPSEAVYFGDDNDDIEPINNCGIGVAVANAIPAVLDVADKITDGNDEDGVAHFLEKHILERSKQYE